MILARNPYRTAPSRAARARRLCRRRRQSAGSRRVAARERKPYSRSAVRAPGARGLMADSTDLSRQLLELAEADLLAARTLADGRAGATSSSVGMRIGWNGLRTRSPSSAPSTTAEAAPYSTRYRCTPATGTPTTSSFSGRRAQGSNTRHVLMSVEVETRPRVKANLGSGIPAAWPAPNDPRTLRSSVR